MGLGDKAPEDVARCYNEFKDVLGDLYPSARFYTQKHSSTISEGMRAYEVAVRQHISSTFRSRTIRYFFTKLSSHGSPFYISCSVSLKKELAGMLYEGIVTDAELTYSDRMKITDAQKVIINNLKRETMPLMGPLPLTDTYVYAHPHEYLPWLYHELRE